jgi:acetyltransferase-like isoleucine patch superfamily enzyme
MKKFIKMWIDYLYLKYHGVETKFGYCRLSGFPIIKRNKKSRIIIEKNVTINSKTEGNIAGINNKVILATLSSDSIIHLKNNSGISGSKLVCIDSIILGEYSGLGANTVIYDTDFHHVQSDRRRTQKSIKEASSGKVIIGKDVLVGANCIILKNTIIEDKVVIGAGSVIANKTLEYNHIYAGNPIKKIRKIK